MIRLDSWSINFQTVIIFFSCSLFCLSSSQGFASLRACSPKQYVLGLVLCRFSSIEKPVQPNPKAKQSVNRLRYPSLMSSTASKAAAFDTFSNKAMQIAKLSNFVSGTSSFFIFPATILLIRGDKTVLGRSGHVRRYRSGVLDLWMIRSSCGW